MEKFAETNISHSHPGCVLAGLGVGEVPNHGPESGGPITDEHGVTCSAVKRSVGSITGFHNRGEGPY